MGPSPWTPEPPGPWDPKDFRILGTLGPPTTSGPEELWEITSTLEKLLLISEPKQSETLKLKHKQKTSLNYMIGQSQSKEERLFF